MEFPSSMPKELSLYTESRSEDILYVTLIKNPHDAVLFFDAVSDDETWVSNHEALMQKLLEWITAQTLTDRLSKSSYRQAFLTIQRHYSLFQSYLPRNVQIKLKDGEILFNSFLLAGASGFFRQLLLNESSEKEEGILSFPQVTVSSFTPIETYICTGEVPYLSLRGQEELLDLIKRANAWELASLSVACEQMLSKYLSVENVFEMLKKAKSERWVYVQQACIEFINEQGWGFKLSPLSFERLFFEFLDFSERTIEFFEQLRPLTTGIICSGKLVEESQFGLVLKECSDLLSLDVSRTFGYSNQFENIPRQLQELNLSECSWLSKDSLKRFLDFCPNLIKLSLRNNVHLTHVFWSELIKFKHLKMLDLSLCVQIQEVDLNLLLRGVSGLTDLSLNSVKKIGEQGFLEMAKNLPRLISLNLSRSSLSDTALVEIAIRCRSLTFLNISSCIELTEKGVLAAIKQMTSLQELDISRCHISTKAIEEIKQTSPKLVLKI